MWTSKKYWLETLLFLSRWILHIMKLLVLYIVEDAK